MKARKSSWRVRTICGTLAALLLAVTVNALAETEMNMAGADENTDVGADGDVAGEIFNRSSANDGGDVTSSQTSSASTHQNSETAASAVDSVANAHVAVVNPGTNGNFSEVADSNMNTSANGNAATEVLDMASTDGSGDASGGAAFSAADADAAAPNPATDSNPNVIADTDAGMNAGPASVSPGAAVTTGNTPRADANTGANQFGVQIAGGVADHDVKKVDLGLVWNPRLQWWHIGGYHFSLVGELHVAYWDIETSQHANPDTWEFGVSPVFRFIKDSGQIRPYIEAGIGVRMLSHVQQEAGHTMSSSFQFVDMVGLGAQFGQRQNYQAGFRFQHLSNAGLEHPNPGIDFSQIYLQYNF